MGSLLFCRMFTYNEIYKAYLDCYKNKKKSPGAILFGENLYNNIRLLTDEINNYTYTFLPSTVFVITDPKLREVFAADFRDRILWKICRRFYDVRPEEFAAWFCS